MKFINSLTFASLVQPLASLKRFFLNLNLLLWHFTLTHPTNGSQATEFKVVPDFGAHYSSSTRRYQIFLASYYRVHFILIMSTKHLKYKIKFIYGHMIRFLCIYNDFCCCSNWPRWKADCERIVNIRRKEMRPHRHT